VVRFPEGVGDYCLLQTLKTDSATYSATMVALLVVKGPGREADHLYRMPRLRMTGAVPPVSHMPTESNLLFKIMHKPYKILKFWIKIMSTSNRTVVLPLYLPRVIFISV
jgi:hypothetical protein